MLFTKDKVTIRIPDDWHGHLRQGELQKFLIRILIMYGWRGIIAPEPNTGPPKLTGPEAMAYAKGTEEYAWKLPHGRTLKAVPIMQITEATTRQMVEEAFDVGVKIFKMYPYAQ